MEKILLPCFIMSVFSIHLKADIKVPLVVPKGTLPMDVYNALSYSTEFSSINIEYSWLTTKGRIISQKEAAQLAFDNDLLDKLIEKLTYQEFLKL